MDSKATEVSFTKWECNFKINHPQTTSKIEQKKYAIENGYEWEIILKQKPPTNIFSYTIESNDLDFWYQPKLTQKEIDGGAFRPDNVVGSYAIYHKTKKNNEYKTGKFGHIYRPNVIDADGNEIWAEFNKDLNDTHILTITIPQAFLDTAKYPVIIDPTFGEEAGGGTQQNIEDAIYGSIFTMGATGGTADSVHGECLGFGAPFIRQVRGAIFLHSDLSLVGTGGEVDAPAASAYVSSTMSSESLSASTDYVLAIWGEPGAIVNTSLSYDATGPGDVGHFDATMAYHASNDPDDPLSATHNVNTYSVYCTYTEGGGGGVSNKLYDATLYDATIYGGGENTEIYDSNIYDTVIE